jgi:hypothetical protein
MIAGSEFMNSTSADGSRVKGERDEFGVLGLLGVKERSKRILVILFEHRKSVEKITQLLLASGCREPAAPHHPDVDGHIP